MSVTVVTSDEASGARDWVTSTRAGLGAVRRHPRSQLTKRLKILQVGADAAAVTTALLLAILLRGLPAGGNINGVDHVIFGLACLPLWLVTFGHYRLYSARTVESRVEEASRFVRAIAVATAGMAVVSYVIRFQASRSLVLGTAVLAFLLCGAEREALRRLFRRMRTSGRLRRRVVIIGSNEEAEAFGRTFRSTAHLGYEAVGFCADEQVAQPGVPWLGPLDAVADLVEATGATTVMIATTSLGTVEANRVVRRLHDAGIHVELSTGLRDIPAERLNVRDLGQHTVCYLEPTVHSGWRAVAKRAFDLVISVVGLLLVTPVLAVCAVIVKLTSSGPALFHQERVGQDGAVFRIHKIRTMVADAEAMVADLIQHNEADGPLFKLRNDPRVTPFGKLLRKLSIDELPQLWNVVKGEMSLVGPRPALVREVPGWTPELHNRLRVKPGLTGMWQVSGRSDGSFDDYVRQDLFYVDNWTLLRDLVILGKTFPAVLLRRGAC